MIKIINTHEQHHWYLSSKTLFLNNLMSVVIVLMVLSILVAGLFLVAFLWSAKTGQLEDLDANAFRILIEDEQENEIKNQIK